MINSTNLINSEEAGPGFKMLYSLAASRSSLSTLCLYDSTPITVNLNKKFTTNVPNQFVQEENTTYLVYPLGFENFVLCDGCSILKSACHYENLLLKMHHDFELMSFKNYPITRYNSMGQSIHVSNQHTYM